jgi:hypothetical protein
MPWALSSRSTLSSSATASSPACSHGRPGCPGTAPASVLQPLVARGRGAHAAQLHQGVEQAQQPLGQARHIGDAAVVRQVHAGRLRGQQALHRLAQHVGLELHRRGGRHDPGAAVGVELAVAQAEGVAGEPAARASSQMQWWCLAWPGVSIRRSAAAAQVARHAIGRGLHAFGRHRQQLAVGCAPSPRRRRRPVRPGTARWGRPCGAGRAGAPAAVARGSSRISAPTPPAWSRCTWVGITQSTASRPGPRVQRAQQARHRAKLVPVSMKAARPPRTSR